MIQNKQRVEDDIVIELSLTSTLLREESNIPTFR